VRHYTVVPSAYTRPVRLFSPSALLWPPEARGLYVNVSVFTSDSHMTMTQQKPMHSSELLCYATHKLGKLDVKHLKTILVNFYSLDDAYTARETIVKLVDDIGIGKWPRPIYNIKRRKDSTGNGADDKMKNVIDDVICV